MDNEQLLYEPHHGSYYRKCFSNREHVMAFNDINSARRAYE